jgi:hypothetical protein
MVYSKDKSNIEEGLKLLKELCLLNTVPESSMCYYHISFGSLRLNKYEDVHYYAERVREEVPKLIVFDEYTANQLLQKTDQLVALADEFLQNPQLSKLLESKRKRKMKIWRSRKDHDKLIKQISVASLTGTQVFNTPSVLSDGTNIPRKSFGGYDSSYSSYSQLPTLPATAKKPSVYNSLCMRSATKRPRNQTPFGNVVRSCANLPEYLNESEAPEYNNEGELNELKQSLSQLREMYNSTFGPQSCVTSDTQNMSCDSQQTPKSTVSTLPLDDFLNDALSDEGLHSSVSPPQFQQFHTPAPPPPTLPNNSLRTSRVIQNSHSTSSNLQTSTRRKAIMKSVTIANNNNPRSPPGTWVIIRRYGTRGGKKIRLPPTIEDLIQVAGEKFFIDAVTIREVSTEAEIEEISAIESHAVLWVMTAQDELHFQ